MNRLFLRIWLIVSITPAIGAVLIRFVWEATIPRPVTSLIIIILLILAALSVYALLFYFTIKPNLKKLKSLPMGILIMVIATGVLIAGIIHYIRFVPSPEAASSLSVIMASLLLTAGISVYLLLLWVIWSIWKRRES